MLASQSEERTGDGVAFWFGVEHSRQVVMGRRGGAKEARLGQGREVGLVWWGGSRLGQGEEVGDLAHERKRIFSIF